jgi:hypothetical protein
MKPKSLITTSKIIVAFLLISLATAVFTVAEEKKQAPVARTGNTDRLERRIDFGNSYILGQSIKSGAVYLLHRKRSEIKSMLKYREDYRKELMHEFNITKLEKGPVEDKTSRTQPSSGK